MTIQEEERTRDELRNIIRGAIFDILQHDGLKSDQRQSSHYQQVVPGERELRISVSGSERAIELLEEALASGATNLEIGIGDRWGPKARVHGRQL